MEGHAVLVGGQNDGIALEEFVRSQGIEITRPGYVTREEFSNATSVQSADKAFANNKLNETDYKNVVKKRKGEVRTARKS